MVLLVDASALRSGPPRKETLSVEHANILHKSFKMNTLYVTVSIPLLLFLAGFNHAHGLTTFGKSSSNNQQTVKPEIRGKYCAVQTDCSLIKNTTCLKSMCLCGNNRPPVNGECMSTLQGPNHLCSKSEDCVDNADCFPIKDLKLPPELLQVKFDGSLSICRCQEGYMETGAACGGEINLANSVALIAALIFYKILY